PMNKQSHQRYSAPGDYQEPQSEELHPCGRDQHKSCSQTFFGLRCFVNLQNMRTRWWHRVLGVLTTRRHPSNRRTTGFEPVFPAPNAITEAGEFACSVN